MNYKEITDEQIIEAATKFPSMKQAYEFLGMTNKPFTRRAKKLGVYKPNVGLTGLPRPWVRAFSLKYISDEQIIDAVKNNVSMCQAALSLNISTHTFNKRAKKLGVLELYKGRKEFKLTSKIPLKDILEGKHPEYSRGSLKKRLIEENIKENKCEGENCNITGEEITLQLDHKNGISNDNKLDNLRFLCPNCHSKTDTFCGKNKRGKEIQKTETNFDILNLIITTEKSNWEILDEVNLVAAKGNYQKINRLRKLAEWFTDNFTLTKKEINDVGSNN